MYHGVENKLLTLCDGEERERERGKRKRKEEVEGERKGDRC